jgi:hypothetical protein
MRKAVAALKCVKVSSGRRQIDEEATMKGVWAKVCGLICVAVFALFGLQPAEAGCELVTATHSAPTRVNAVETSQALALLSAHNVQRARGWSSVTLSAHQVAGDPFWKAVRPNGVPPKARLQPDIVTAQFYTTCFRGVVVPFVCTTGSSVCGK